MVQNGKSFAIVRVYQSNGKPDPNGNIFFVIMLVRNIFSGPYSINDAWSAGMSHVDGYIFPCYSCGNPAKQMDDTINSLKSAGVKLLGVNSDDKETLLKANNGTLGATVGMLWIDVEGTQYWSSSTSSNVDFIQGMVDEGLKQGVSLGVYVYVRVLGVLVVKSLLQASTPLPASGLLSAEAPLSSASILSGIPTTTTARPSATFLLSEDGASPRLSSTRAT